MTKLCAEYNYLRYINGWDRFNTHLYCKILIAKLSKSLKIELSETGTFKRNKK